MDAAPIDKAVGRKLKGLRAENDITQEDLARLSGISAATIWRIEKGERSARLDQLDAICRALGIEMHDLVKAAVETMKRTSASEDGGLPPESEVRLPPETLIETDPNSPRLGKYVVSPDIQPEVAEELRRRFETEDHMRHHENMQSRTTQA